MGIFSKQGGVKSQQSATTLITKGCTVTGHLKLESDIQVDGLVEGQVNVAKALLISESGRVNGEVYAGHVVVNGEFEGTCYADRIEILQNGRVRGAIYTDNLSIDQGGKFNGETHPAKETTEAEEKVTAISKA